MANFEQTTLGATILLNEVMKARRIRNDSQLARFLKASPATICNIRYGRSPVTANLVLTIHETIDMPIAKIRKLLISDPRKKKQPA
jgi:plasmid maintenance system antidote protein VapI